MVSRKQHARDIGRIAEDLGYQFAGKTRRGHLKWLAPGGMTVITGSNLRPACGFANAVTQLRQFQHRPPINRGARP
jgi:hypothetical protein